MMSLLFDDDVCEEDFGVREEDVEYAMTDLQRRAQHDRHVLQTHLILLLLQLSYNLMCCHTEMPCRRHRT